MDRFPPTTSRPRLTDERAYAHRERDMFGAAGRWSLALVFGAIAIAAVAVASIAALIVAMLIGLAAVVIRFAPKRRPIPVHEEVHARRTPEGWVVEATGGRR